MQLIDLAMQQKRIREKIDLRIADVLNHGQYILGPEVKYLEEALAEFCGARRVLTCANGTDALQLALMALGVKHGDAVFCPAFTFAATAEAVPLLNATPVFVDVDPVSFNMSSTSLERAIAHAQFIGLSPKVVIPVDLFGLPADYEKITAVAAEYGMKILSDAAQSFGARYQGHAIGAVGDIATTSFFPSKPLGCYGDGGAVLTSDDGLADTINSLRFHGQGSSKYDSRYIGLNSRLDTLQAAILLEKLAIFPEELILRQQVAERYHSSLTNLVQTPLTPNEQVSTWAQYTIVTDSAVERTRLQKALKAASIPSAVYYPKPLHLQTAYSAYPIDPSGLHISEDLSHRVLSLPMHPYLSLREQNKIIETIQIELLGK